MDVGARWAIAAPRPGRTVHASRVNLRDRLDASLAALHAIGGRPALVRLVAALVLRSAGTAMGLVAYLIVAYEAGGATALALLGLARMLPATLVALFTGAASRRYGHEQLLVASHLVRAAAAAVAALALATGLPVVVVFVSSGVSAAAGAFVRPLHTSMLPELAQAPDELVAANVASGVGEGAASLVGPALGGLLVATIGSAATIGLAGVMALAAAGLVATIRVADHAAAHRSAEHRAASDRAALAALRERPAVIAVIAGFGAQTLVRGLLTTLTVVASIELLGLGQVGVGALNTALGVGGLVGAVGSMALAGRRSLGGAFALALVWWGLPIAGLGAWPLPAVAFVSLGVVGLSNALLSVAGYTLLQRSIPARSRTSVLGLLEGVSGLGIALGGLLAPILIGAFGVRGALAATGVLLPVVAAASWPRLARVDDGTIVPERELRALRQVRLFAPLSVAAQEDLARSALAVRFAPGDLLMREGEPGDRYLVIGQGRVEVTQRGERIRVCGPGDGLGEIALLRRVPRTATVRALEPTLAYAIRPEAFIAAVTGNSAAASEANELIDERLVGGAPA
jgi:MFS family permease